MVARPEISTSASGPVRTCIGCRERTAKRELLRIVAGADATGQWSVVPDPTGTAPGRGAHLHPTAECLARAERRRAFARALRHDAGVRGALGLDALRQHLGQTDSQTDTATHAPPDQPIAPRKNGSTSS